jgi:hypothetical protein
MWLHLWGERWPTIGCLKEWLPNLQKSEDQTDVGDVLEGSHGREVAWWVGREETNCASLQVTSCERPNSDVSPLGWNIWINPLCLKVHFYHPVAEILRCVCRVELFQRDALFQGICLKWHCVWDYFWRRAHEASKNASSQPTWAAWIRLYGSGLEAYQMPHQVSIKHTEIWPVNLLWSLLKVQISV